MRRAWTSLLAMALLSGCPAGRADAPLPTPTATPAGEPCPDDACVERAVAMLDGEDAEHGVRLLQAACGAGVGAGCHHLALAYWDGRGVDRSTGTAGEYLRRNCNNGYVESCINLSVLYEKDPALPRTYGRASEVLADACNLLVGTTLTESMRDDVLRACNSLGLMYFRGSGVAIDPVRGEALLAKACEGGLWMACDNLGLYLVEAKRGPEALALFEKGCDGNFADSCANLGMAHMTGTGVAKNEKRARELFEAACQRDSGLGCFNLAICHQEGRGGPQDQAAARQLFEKGCQLGFSAACNEAAELDAPPPQ